MTVDSLASLTQKIQSAESKAAWNRSWSKKLRQEAHACECHAARHDEDALVCDAEIAALRQELETGIKSMLSLTTT